VVLAPATIEDAFRLTVKAFNLSEKYQLPVIVLTDHYLATVYATVERFDIKQVKIERGDLDAENAIPAEYRRHRITPSGISPRAFPGLTKALVVTDCDEHDETGHLIEDAKTRSEQMQKRLRKMIPLKQEMIAPEIYGPQKAKTTVIGWGSTYGALCEAVDVLRQEDEMNINLLHFDELWPFPTERVADILKKAKNSYVVENNATGQLARLIRQETGTQVTGTILKYDGRPFTPGEIVRKLREEVH
jgi:2-oxoglutarate ferredoxin oxidoreductase subunit alpha